jgi:outer membrane protein OmpA-like peptidoglycan-associated protein
MFTMNGQMDYDHLTFEEHVFFPKIIDVMSVKPFGISMGAYYMANTKIGAKLSGSYTRIQQHKEYDFINPEEPLSYVSSQLMGIINVGRIAQMEELFNNRLTVLVGIGGDYMYSTGHTNDLIAHRISNFHLAGEALLKVRFTDQLFLSTGINVVTGVNSRPFIKDLNTNTTSIVNFNIGVAISIGKHKQHAYWYLHPEKKADTIIIDKTETITNNIYNETILNCKHTERIFFEFGKSEIDPIAGNNAITKATDQMEADDKIYIIGKASLPGTESLNMDLSMKRALTVKDKMMSIGISEDKIVIDFVGEIATKNGKNIDLSQMVEIIVKKQ